MFAEFWRKLAFFFRREKFHHEMEEEMQHHLALKRQAHAEKGAASEESRFAAQREFGNTLLLRERSRDMWGFRWLETFLQDIRFALRMLRKSPGFTAVAVLTLALGIGANTAIFSLIDAVMLRSLPIRDPQQLLILEWRAAHEPDTNSSYNWSGCPGVSADSAAPPGGCTFSYPMFEQLRSRRDIFSDLYAFIATQPHLTLNGSVSMANGFLVSGDFFATLGTRAILGRTLGPADDQLSSQPTAMLSYAFWKSRFGGDPSIIGKSILLEKTPFIVVGITAPGFAGINPGRSVDVWMPLSSQAYVAPYFPKRTAANSTWLEMMARLKPGVSRSQAQSALRVLFTNATASGPTAMFKPTDSPRIELISAARGLTSLRQQFSQPLFALMACVVIILLIACANVGGLFLARASSRRREIAMRLTLGATRGRVARQLLTESLLTSLLGATLGILLAYWSASALAAFLSANLYSPIDLDVRPDGLVLTFTIGVAVLAAVLFGLAPALQGTRIGLAPALKGVDNGPSALFAARRLAFGSLLVVAQVALSIVVLAGAGLLVRTLINLERMNVGFETDHLLLFSVDMTMAGYTTFDHSPQVYQLDRTLQTRLAALPGVTSATYSMVPLLSGDYMSSDFKLPAGPSSSAFSAGELPVGPGFFGTMRIPLLSGRTFTAADFDSSATPEPAVINQLFTKKLFGAGSPLGRDIALSESKKAQWQIVGVGGDARYNSLREAILPMIYTLKKNSGAEFELRTKSNPTALIPSVRDAVNHVNRSLLVSDFKTQTEQIDQLLYQERLVAGLSSLFAALSLLLACIGLYGLLSYEVVRRTRELGIRVALGAQRCDLLRLVVGQGIVLVLIGAAIGFGAAIGVTRFVAPMLYGIRASDPLTFAAVSLLLLGVALFACYIPARRAMRVDPMVALRYE
ncbi:MAG: ADOP family duplicated permease [Candidatus Acidiferrales bacterium]